MKAVLLISHGSRFARTKAEVAALVNRLREHSGVDIFEYAFLEIEEPNIPDGIARCVEKGATEVLVLLNFLNSGRHVDEDIPAIVELCQTIYPQVRIMVSDPVGQQPEMEAIFQTLIRRSF